jgi:glutathione S-transferase
MKLYDMVKAPNPRRVRIFLAEKGIEIKRVEVDIPGGANLAPDYLAVNPRGVVPTLVLDDGTTLDESIAICRYFEALNPEPNLFGRDALEQARVEAWQRRCEFEGLFNIAMVFRNTAAPFANRAMPGTNPALPQIAELAERGRVLTWHFLDTLNERLGRSAYLAGDRYTVADITGLVAVDFAKWVQIRVPEDHANTRRWYEAVASRPSARA